MIQCKDCEFCEFSDDGKRIFKCDPFSNIKEPHCLEKWQLLRLDMLLASYQSMVTMQSKMAPMQNKVMKYIKRELDDLDESDRWKTDDTEDDDDKPNPEKNEYL